MGNLRFEKVGDMNLDYPILEVYAEDQLKPFMDISANANKELEFFFYQEEGIKLSVENMEALISIGKGFLIRITEDEDDFKNWQERGYQ